MIKIYKEKVTYEVYNCYMIKIYKEKVTYEVLNDRNLQTKQFKKHIFKPKPREIKLSASSTKKFQMNSLTDSYIELCHVNIENVFLDFLINDFLDLRGL